MAEGHRGWFQTFLHFFQNDKKQQNNIYALMRWEKAFQTGGQPLTAPKINGLNGLKTFGYDISKSQDLLLTQGDGQRRPLHL